MQHRLTLVLVYLIYNIVTHTSTGCNGLQFYYNQNFTTDSSGKILLEQISQLSASQPGCVNLLPEPGVDAFSYPLTSYPAYAVSELFGWMMYRESVAFVDPTSKKAQSFNTSFTFQLKTTKYYNDCPSGMVFFVSTYPNSPRNASNKYFGLGDAANVGPASNPFFAVEFDTFLSKEVDDPSASHIGIDISSVNSVPPIVDTANSSNTLYLYNDYTFTCWISYDASDTSIKVWMANDASGNYAGYFNPPDSLAPITQTKFDLSSVFIVQKNMYVGFSGATDLTGTTTRLGAVICSWYFSLNDDINVSVTSAVAHSESNGSQSSPPISNIAKIVGPIVAVLAMLGAGVILQMKFNCIDCTNFNCIKFKWN